MSNNLTKVAEDSTRGGFYLTLGDIVSTLVSAVSIFIIARVIGPEQYGLYSISTTIPSLLVLLVNPGLNQGIVKYAASLKAKGQHHRIAGLLLHGLIFRVVLGLTATLACFAFSQVIAQSVLKRPEIGPYVQFASMLIVLHTTFSTANSILIGLDKAEYCALITNSQAVSKALISSILVILGLGVYGALSGYVMSCLIASIVAAIIMREAYRRLKHAHGMSDESLKTNLKMLVRYGFPLYVSTLLGAFMLQYQNVLLAIFTSDSDVGNFTAAANFRILLNTLSISIGTVLLAAFSKLESGEEETKRFFRLSVRYVSMIVVPTATFMILLSKDLVATIYGEGYRTASFLLSLDMIQFFLIGLGSTVLISLFNGLGETKTTLRMSLLTFLTFVPLAPVATWILGVPGTIVAYVVSILIANLYGLSVARARLGIRIEIGKTARVYAASLSSVVPFLAMHQVLPLEGLGGIAFGALIYFADYVLLCPLFKAISKRELEDAEKIVRTIKPLNTVAGPLLRFEGAILSKTASLKL